MARRRTAKQRAALRKAQLASARKRRRRRNIAIGASAAAIGIGVGVGAGLVGHRYVGALKGGPKRVRHVSSKSGYRINGMLALPPGRSATKVKADKRRPIPARKGVFVVSPGGSASYRKRHRPEYDAARRASYKPRKRVKYGPRRL